MNKMQATKNKKNSRRRYAPYWEKLKNDKLLTILCDAKTFQRIRRAIIKEKDEDILFKMECAESDLYYRIVVKDVIPVADKNKIRATFSLELRNGSSLF